MNCGARPRRRYDWVHGPDSRPKIWRFSPPMNLPDHTCPLCRRGLFRFEKADRLLKTVSRMKTGRMLKEKQTGDRKSTRLNSSHVKISYAVFCLKKKKKHT